jgi:hypothetical protein
MTMPNAHNALLYGLKVPSAPAHYFNAALNPAASQLPALEFQRAQLCDYRQLLGLRQYQALHASGLGPYAYLDPYTQYLYKAGDPRARFVQEEPKPNHSYIGLIAMAILSSKEKKLVLSDIYQWILDHYPYFRTRGPGWRNSIRHNLSLNDCFIKSGRSANGKGHYWAVHPANVEDFTRGDFRRRRAQRKVRRHMGLSVPDDDDDSPSPSPHPWMQSMTGPDSLKDDCDNNNLPADERSNSASENDNRSNGDEGRAADNMLSGSHVADFLRLHHQHQQGGLAGSGHVSKKRLFDVESLLAPDLPRTILPRVPVIDPSALHSHRALPPNFLCGPSALSVAHRNPFHMQQSSLHNSDVESTTSEQARVSDESDIDIEGEDGDEDLNVSDKARMQGDISRDHDDHDSSSLHGDEEKDGEANEMHRPSSVDVKHGDTSATEDREDGDSPRRTSSSFAGTGLSPLKVNISTATNPSSPEASSSALDLSSSSSTSTSPMTSIPMTSLALPVMSAGSALMIPRAVDNAAAMQRARWMGLSMAGLGPINGMGGLAAGPPGADLGSPLRRFSAFHAAGGAGGSPTSLRCGAGPLATPSVAPFLHPLFAAAR